MFLLRVLHLESLFDYASPTVSQIRWLFLAYQIKKSGVLRFLPCVRNFVILVLTHVILHITCCASILFGELLKSLKWRTINIFHC